MRWIYGGSTTMKATTPEFNDGCAIRGEPLVCNPGEGVTGYELVNGEVDLDYADRQTSTIVRIVGDMVFRAGFVQAQIDDQSTLLSVPPMWRCGLIVMDGLPAAAAPLQAPDLWDDDANEDADWMWRAHFDFAEGDMYQPSEQSAWQAVHGNFKSLVESVTRYHVDVKVNRKISKEGSLLLVAQMGWFNPFDIVIPEEQKPRVIMFNDLRVLVKN